MNAPSTPASPRTCPHGCSERSSPRGRAREAPSGGLPGVPGRRRATAPLRGPPPARPGAGVAAPGDCGLSSCGSCARAPVRGPRAGRPPPRGVACNASCAPRRWPRRARCSPSASPRLTRGPPGRARPAAGGGRPGGRVAAPRRLGEPGAAGGDGLGSRAAPAGARAARPRLPGVAAARSSSSPRRCSPPAWTARGRRRYPSRAGRRRRRARDPGAPRRSADPQRAAPARARVGRGARGAPATLDGWSPATAIQAARRASRAPTAGGRSAPTA